MVTLALKPITIVPTIVPAAYSDGEQLGAGVIKLERAALGMGLVSIRQILLVDKIKQNKAIDLLFFGDTVTPVSADNAPVDVTDADLVAYLQGHVSVGATYVSLANGAYSIVTPNLLVRSLNKDGHLYVLPVMRAAGTYAGAADLSINIVVEQLSRQ